MIYLTSGIEKTADKIQYCRCARGASFYPGDMPLNVCLYFEIILDFGTVIAYNIIKLEKGKPPEKAGRKVTGLSPIKQGIGRQSCRASSENH